MKKLILSLVAIATISLSSFGQAPEGFKYQAVVRDAGGVILNNQSVGMRLTILQGSIGGTSVYQETFAPSTNAYGIVNLEIGNGTVVSGDFTTIDWANGPYFMETAVDLTSGTSYAVMGTSQLMSVPYALHAKTSGNGLPSGGLEGQELKIVDGIPTWVCDISIGDIYEGGIVFYIDTTFCHGLVASLEDIPFLPFQWGCAGTLLPGAMGEEIGTGFQNTMDIIGNCISPDIPAAACANYNFGGYSDWFLPSKDELNEMLTHIGNLGYPTVSLNISLNNYYWSSTQQTADWVWVQQVGSYGQYNDDKIEDSFRVRAIRAF